MVAKKIKQKQRGNKTTLKNNSGLRGSFLAVLSTIFMFNNFSLYFKEIIPFSLNSAEKKLQNNVTGPSLSLQRDLILTFSTYGGDHLNTIGSFHVNSTNRPASTSQIELVIGTFTDHNMIKLLMDFYRIGLGVL